MLMQTIVADFLTFHVSCSTADRWHSHESANSSLKPFLLPREESRDETILDNVFSFLTTSLYIRFKCMVVIAASVQEDG